MRTLEHPQQTPVGMIEKKTGVRIRRESGKDWKREVCRLGKKGVQVRREGGVGGKKDVCWWEERGVQVGRERCAS